MRILWVAVALSACVIVGCAAWSERIAGNATGPDHSVDFRPLVPIVAGAVVLAFIWLTAGLAWLFRLGAKHREDFSHVYDR